MDELAKFPHINEPNPYYNALLSIIAVVQEKGECSQEILEACLEAEGIGEFYSYVQILNDATAGDTFEGDEDYENPEQENDADSSEEFEA